MKSLVTALALTSVMACTVAALADETPSSGTMSAQAMTMPSAGPEAKALAAYFAGSGMTWTGMCPAGAMGPDSKETHTRGMAKSHSMYDGMWMVWDVEDNMGTGKDAMTWRGHMMVGWDATAKTYRCVSVDNMGTMAMYNGTLDGDTFTLETPEPIMSMGKMHKDKLTWVKKSDGTYSFTDQVQNEGSTDWTMMESGMGKSMMAGKTKAKPEKMKMATGDAGK